jgi:hypothetical protein
MRVPDFSTSNTWYSLECQRVRIVLRVEKSHFDHELCILFFRTSLMKMSLDFKFLYNYFAPLFFEFSGPGVSINANNSVLNFYINK